MLHQGATQFVHANLSAINTAIGIHCADHATPSNPQKLALTSPTSGGRLVGIVCSWTKATISVQLGAMPVRDTAERIYSYTYF
jgi:hypothetical protein